MPVSAPALAGGLPLLARHRSERVDARVRRPIVLVTHVLATAVPFIQALAEDHRLEAVLAIPYSYDPAAAAALEGIEVIVPADTTELERILLRTVRRVDERGEPFVVQEIGGYLVPALEAGHRFDRLLGVVEDTRQGHWRYRDVEDRLPFPVLSVAESPLKALEHHQIGRAVVFSLERQVRRHFYRSLSGESVAVIGFGDIGSAAAKALRGRDAHVVVHDVDPVRQASAWLQGFRVASLPEAIATSNLILGCSGSRSLRADVLRLAPDGAIFASGSSKQVEIDVDFFLSEPGDAGELVQRVQDGRRIFLLNEGKPLNFLDGSAIGSTLDLVYTELCACTEEIAQGRVQGTGLMGLSDRAREELAIAWLSVYAEARRPNLEAPVSASRTTHATPNPTEQEPVA